MTTTLTGRDLLIEHGRRAESTRTKRSCLVCRHFQLSKYATYAYCVANPTYETHTWKADDWAEREEDRCYKRAVRCTLFDDMRDNSTGGN